MNKKIPKTLIIGGGQSFDLLFKSNIPITHNGGRTVWTGLLSPQEWVQILILITAQGCNVQVCEDLKV